MRVEREGPLLRVTLARPEKRNAFNDETVDALTDAAARARSDEEIRVVLLAGDGPIFCAGADIAWMRELGGKSDDENRASAERMAGMYAALDELPRPLVARVHGACIGGGLGIVAVCDIVVATPSCVFATSEVRLGILPAVIGPYVLRRIGESRCRDVMLTGRRFTAREAANWGLAQHVTSSDDPATLDATTRRVLDELMHGSPAAQTHIKSFLRELGARGNDGDLDEWTAGEIARARTTPDAREGLAAFLEKRRPSWAPEEEA